MYLTWTKKFWTPNSPDLNPLDYFVWGEVEASNKDVQQPKEALKRTIQDTMKKINRPVVKRAHGMFRD